ncbi:disulfide bond formation protein B [Helicobacter sp. T3_23-1059]
MAFGAYFWFFCAFCSFFLVGISHLFFQGYLFMQPCEQCVYIRYAFIVMGFGGIFLGVSDCLALRKSSNNMQKSHTFNKNNIAHKLSFLSKILGFVLGFYGSVRGIFFAWVLLKIHRALNDFDMDSSEVDFSQENLFDLPNFFGLQGCSMQPSFDFGLPLDRWLPSVFAPTGDCGQDFALPPSDIALSYLQAYFVELYSQGWYLLPSAKFGSMAECCLLAFGVGFLIFCVAFVRALLARIFFYKNAKIC